MPLICRWGPADNPPDFARKTVLGLQAILPMRSNVSLAKSGLEAGHLLRKTSLYPRQRAHPSINNTHQDDRDLQSQIVDSRVAG